MAIEFSECTPSDINDILALEHLLFDNPLSDEAIQFELTLNPYAHYYKLSEKTELIGYGGIQVILEDAHLMTIGIKQSYQKQGLGKILLAQLIDKAKMHKAQRMILEVATNNHPALHLYESCGFKKGRTRLRYYGEENAYEMILDWKQER